MALFLPYLDDPNYIPWSDPIIPITIGKPGGQLITDDWGGKFEVEGNIRLAALAALEYALSFRTIQLPGNSKCGGIGFSRLEFDFSNGVQIKQRWGKNDILVELFIEEIKKLTNLMVFI